MLVYLNRGLILEQAICDLIHEYFQNINLEEKYKNFHVSVTTQHPFAELYMHEGLNASDSFPCIIVTTQEDRKPYEFTELAPHTAAIGIDEEDLMDFDVALSGAHIAFEVNYCVEQIVLNTELKELNAENIITEVLNRVKE